MILSSTRLLIALLLMGLLPACTFVQEQYPKIPPGPYRAVLKLENNPIIPNPKGKPLPEKLNLEFDEVTDGELPFTFEAVYEDDTTFYLDIINGDERIRVPSKNIGYGNDITQARDTIRIDFPVYDTYIQAYHEEGIIEGVWVVNYRDQYRIPFLAKFGEAHRFTQLRKAPVVDLSGEWAMTFSLADKPYLGLGEFKQDGNHLSGTIRTETGDYRFLEGTVQANKLYLSVFDGSHAFLFEGIIKEDGTLNGSFRSGRHYITDFVAKRDPDFQLADPDTLTSLVSDGPISFSFPDANGDSLSLDDPQFAGKYKLIQIMGTWCPNCRDETNYLRDYLAENPSDQLAMITLAFERYGPDDPRSRQAIKRYHQNMDVDWPILLAGSYKKDEAAQALPMLNHILSFPTLLLVDPNNEVQYIHTGFNGPATSKFAAFDRAFREMLGELLLAKDS
ncbi:MAG: TlpA disulfide reductase family protein [Bacteroidota bacterium]